MLIYLQIFCSILSVRLEINTFLLGRTYLQIVTVDYTTKIRMNHAYLTDVLIKCPCITMLRCIVNTYCGKALRLIQTNFYDQEYSATPQFVKTFNIRVVTYAIKLSLHSRHQRRKLSLHSRHSRRKLFILVFEGVARQLELDTPFSSHASC